MPQSTCAIKNTHVPTCPIVLHYCGQRYEVTMINHFCCKSQLYLVLLLLLLLAALSLQNGEQWRLQQVQYRWCGSRSVIFSQHLAGLNLESRRAKRLPAETATSPHGAFKPVVFWGTNRSIQRARYPTTLLATVFSRFTCQAGTTREPSLLVDKMPSIFDHPQIF